MLLIAYLMVSAIRYPSLKSINWRARIRFRTFILIFVGAVLLWRFWGVGLAIVFHGYIFYGIVLNMRKMNRRSKRLKQLRERRPDLVKKSQKTSE
jgi:CDP-diacylglycerol--serine O-phosphatidyltransferase